MPYFHSSLKRVRSLIFIDPERDWIILLIISAGLFSGVMIWNMFLFNTVANGGVIGSQATTTPSVFNQSSIDAIHTVFANRAAEELKYRTDVYHYTDPSQ